MGDEGVESESWLKSKENNCEEEMTQLEIKPEDLTSHLREKQLKAISLHSGLSHREREGLRPDLRFHTPVSAPRPDHSFKFSIKKDYQTLRREHIWENSCNLGDQHGTSYLSAIRND